MPQRTNDFQELVSLIRTAFAREGDKITDSAMVRVQGLEAEREIDILHETDDGITTVKIALEARDEARPIDLTALEALSAKYRGEGRVCVDKFVIVSKSGFTKGAIERAKMMDVPLLTLEEAKHFDWAQFGPQYAGLHDVKFMAGMRIAPRVMSVRIVPELGAGFDDVAVTEGQIVCPNGCHHGTPWEYAQNMMAPGRCPPEHIRELEDAARANPAGATAHVGWPLPGHARRLRGNDFPLREVHATVACMNASAEGDWTAHQLKNVTNSSAKTKLIQHGTVRVGGKKIDVVMPDGLNSKKVIVRVQDEKKTPKQKAVARKKKRRKS